MQLHEEDTMDMGKAQMIPVFSPLTRFNSERKESAKTRMPGCSE